MNFNGDFKLGILGGGQLGRMLIQAGIDLNLQFHVLDPDPDAPCSGLVKDFKCGSLTDYDTVVDFGKDLDLITIEIENVNTEALEELQRRGVKVYPQPEIVRTIQDKRLQKQFYRENSIPTSDFILVESKEEIKDHTDFLPAYQKLGKAGYDGRGVFRINSGKDAGQALEGPSLLEKLVDFEKEISVLVARNARGEILSYPVVEMVFHPERNLVEYLFAPADLAPARETEARAIAEQVIEAFGMTGLLAVEMFLDRNGNILVNEVAPRPHNSGHQTIKANFTSQYEQHLRAILDLPLGSPALKQPAAMVNLLGEPGYEGPVKYQGVGEILKIEGVYLHLYGKKYTKPFRKMGHVTILAHDKESLKEKARFVKETIKVIA